MPHLSRFKVIGWGINPDAPKEPRFPMKEARIDAPNANAAAQQYARTEQIPPAALTGRVPAIIIRVEREGRAS